MARFKTRARTMDMLGKQQIAGIPTAVSELFKNAHDAYADRVEVDFFRAEGLFVLRDDGVGMTLSDFEDRWLTIGTESKLDGGRGIEAPPRDPSKKDRPVLGEKGIGRLSVATIGCQVLVLTRAKYSRDDLVAALINWNLFSLPGVDLDQIIIPVKTYASGTLPTGSDVQEMVELCVENVLGLAEDSDSLVIEQLLEQLHGFKVDPAELDKKLGEPTLRGDGYGTHFFISPTDDSLVEVMASDSVQNAAPPLQKLLIGFSNTMIPGHEAPRLAVAFRDHQQGRIEDVIDSRDFFSPEDFSEADHHIEGSFDEYGQFSGKISVYGEQTTGYKVPWNAMGIPSECGPFSINFGAMQGAMRESAMPAEQWLKMNNKLQRLGGLYIYRDGIRVLPYGDNDYDWLDVEKNRTKSARYYYFSYRKMFGAIEIKRDTNGELIEKAGREGFIENKAYRQFRDILKKFMVQVAADFFREEGVYGERFFERRAELDRIERAKRAREKRKTARRNRLKDDLNRVFDALSADEPQQNAAQILSTVQTNLKSALDFEDPRRISRVIVDTEMDGLKSLTELREQYFVSRPRGIGLTKEMERDFDAYRTQYNRMVASVIDPAMKQMEQLVLGTTNMAGIALDRRVRLDRRLSVVVDQARQVTAQDSKALQSALKESQAHLVDLARDVVADIDAIIKDILSQAASVNASTLSDEEFVQTRDALEQDLTHRVERGRHALQAVTAQVSSISWSRDEGEDVVTDADVTEVLEDEVLALRERAEADLELTELGMAVQVINHEFDASIRSVRRNLRMLHEKAGGNEDLLALYGAIRNSFDHLDGYLTLFTPLQRRLYRKQVAITGADIEEFLSHLFRDRLTRHEIRLIATPEFRQYTMNGYPSTFYPVFVNLIDNAIYWTGSSSEPRQIVLSCSHEAMEVSDTGPGIPERDATAVFELGFTRKLGGRGMGLHISRAVLAKEGYALGVAPSESGKGAKFVISPMPKEETEE